jgi:O-antigen ligase
VPKVAGIAGLAIFTDAILLSGSREALSATLLIMLYFLIRSRHRLQLGIAVAVLLTFVLSVQTSIWTRFSTLLETGGSGRTSIWAVAVQAAKQRPIQGYGIGNFQEAYDLYYIGVHQTYPFGWNSPAHNLVLHYQVELGFVGLLLIALFFWSAFRSLRFIDAKSELYDERIAMEGALIAIAFVSLTIDLFTYKYAWLVLFLIAFLRNAAPAAQPSAVTRAANSPITAALSARAASRALP